MYSRRGHCHLTVTTEPSGSNAGVYIRALCDVNVDPCTDGPGKLCRAFEVNMSLNGMPVDRDGLFIDGSAPVERDSIAVTTRIGVGKGRDLPYRFVLSRKPVNQRILTERTSHVNCSKTSCHRTQPTAGRGIQGTTTVGNTTTSEVPNE